VIGPADPDRLEEELAAEHARYSFDDAAYLLGALEPGQHADFERHLARCPVCRQRTAEFDELPAALARADISAWEPELPPDTLLPRLLREAAASRRRQAWRLGVLATAAACLVALLATAGVLGWQQAHRPQTLTMQPVGPGTEGVHATVRILGDDATPRIRLECGYAAGTANRYPTTGPSYRMVVYNRAGLMRDLGSWTPQPGEDVELVRDSPWRRQALARIEISDSTGAVLLRLSL